VGGDLRRRLESARPRRRELLAVFGRGGNPLLLARIRAVGATPHVAAKEACGAIDARTTRHPGYAVSQQRRKRIEEIFGWMKTVGLLRKLRHRGVARVNWTFVFTAAAYNLVRMRTLAARPA